MVKHIKHNIHVLSLFPTFYHGNSQICVCNQFEHFHLLPLSAALTLRLLSINKRASGIPQAFVSHCSVPVPNDLAVMQPEIHNGAFCPGPAGFLCALTMLKEGKILCKTDRFSQVTKLFTQKVSCITKHTNISFTIIFKISAKRNTSRMKEFLMSKHQSSLFCNENILLQLCIRNVIY